MTANANFTLETYRFSGTANLGTMDYCVADFNNDSHMDVIVTYFYWPIQDLPTRTNILWGDGSGGFTQATDSQIQGGMVYNTWGRQIIVADFNGDLRNDVFIADHGYDASPYAGAQNTLLLSNSAGGLINATVNLPQVIDFSHSASAADIDSDGDIDLFVNNMTGSSGAAPYLLINSGRGVFTTNNRLPNNLLEKNYFTSSCAFIDYDSNGTQDLIIAPYSTDEQHVRILVNTGNGDFAGSEFSFAINPIGVHDNVVDTQIYDVNHDGKLDIIFSIALNNYSTADGRISIFLNQGNGQFIDHTENLVSDPYYINWATRNKFVDVNADGYVDIVQYATTENSNSLPILLNDGEGYFVRLPKNTTGSTESFTGVISDYDLIIPGDFNEDGKTDFISRRYFDSSTNHEIWGLYEQRSSASIKLGSDTEEALIGGVSSDSLSGLGGNDVLFGGEAHDTLLGGTGNDYLNGGTGNDQITPGLGDDTVNGGLGVDRAVFDALSATAATALSSSAFTVRGKSGEVGTDTVKSIELIQFTDLTFETEWFSKTDALTASQSESLVELYIASFNRAPDAIGLNYWGGRLYDGMSLPEIAKSFFVQPETVAAYPSSMATRTFVTTVYNNVLSRSPDTDGLNYWVREIDTGSFTKDVFLLAIINGAKASTGSAIDRATLANKVTVGEYFAFDKGINNATWGIDVMDSVTSVASTVTAANALTDSYSAAIATGTASSSAMLLGVPDTELVTGLL
jgi:Ca2+-binding RTX toxin-like protein